MTSSSKDDEGVTHYPDSSVAKTLDDGTRVLSNYVDESQGETLEADDEDSNATRKSTGQAEDEKDGKDKDTGRVPAKSGDPAKPSS